MGCVARRGHLVAALALAGLAILGSVVRVLGVERRCWLVVGIEGALSSATRAFAGLLTALVRGAVGLRPWAGHTRGISHPREGLSGRKEEWEGERKGLHVEGLPLRRMLLDGRKDGVNSTEIAQRGLDNSIYPFAIHTIATSSRGAKVVGHRGT